MKSRRCLTLLVLFLFLSSLLPPPVSAAKAGDALIRIFHKDVRPPEDLLPDDALTTGRLDLKRNTGHR